MARLAVIQEFDSPVPEASGLCTFDVGGVEQLAVVGDKDLTIAYGPVTAEGVPADWQVLDLESDPRLPAQAGQFEAVADAGAGRLLLLGEEPSVVILVGIPSRQVTNSWHLDVSADPELSRLWNRDPNSRGEGLILGPGGRLLVIKEKAPVLAVEFGPADSDQAPGDGFPHPGPWEAPQTGRLPARQWTAIESAPADVSDCTMLGNHLLALSDQDACVTVLRRTNTGWAAGDRHRLDKSVRKPEGIAVTSDGVMVVAMDRPKPDGAMITLSPPDLRPR